MTTFAQQAETYLTAAATRQRHPMRTGTARSYRSYLRAHLLPALGDLDLSAVGNASVRPIIANLSAKLKPATIQPIFNLIKQIVASDVDENGDQKHPRTWNSEFLDIPVLDSTAQHAPIMARKTLQEAFLGGSEQDRLLWAFLAGSGVRIAEAFAVHTSPDGPGNYWDRAAGTVRIDAQRHEDGSLAPTKTAAGRRIVDLCQPLNDLMLKLAPAEGFVFANGERAARKRFDKLVPNMGFHSFRRFRRTHLDNSLVPLGLSHYWIGHKMAATDSHYVKWGSDIEKRREWADRVGLGFELPS